MNADRRDDGPRELRLVGAFQMRKAGRAVVVPHSAARLVAAAALVGPLSRTAAALALWPDFDLGRGMANLRAALARLGKAGRGFVDIAGDVIHVAEDVQTDVDDIMGWIDAAIYGNRSLEAVAAPPQNIGRELLAGWDEDWIIEPRERLSLMQTQALEMTAERLVRAGKYSEALAFALGAVRIQPWSESANKVLIEIHARQGDRGNALRRYFRFREVLRGEVGVEPGPEIVGIVRQFYRLSHDGLADTSSSDGEAVLHARYRPGGRGF